MCLEKLLKIVTPAKEDGADFREWSEQSAFFDLLAEQRNGTPVILYSSSFNHGSLLLQSILVPIKDLKKAKTEDMMRWDNPFGSWQCGLVYGGNQPPRLEFSEPLSRIQPSAFKRGQQLVFSRSFAGRTEDKHYYEISPFLTHAHELHWTPERRAWCRFDRNGDVDDLIRLDERVGRSGYGDATCITADRELIEMQMSATGTALVQMFDLTSVGGSFHGWNERIEESVESIENPKIDLYYRSHQEGVNGSWTRGLQIIRPRLSSRGFGKYLYDKDREPKRYVSFITQDVKNDRIAEVSCAPDAMASYFDASSLLPYQISPVFFNAAVLDKYKADPEKYTVEQRSISCRNAWHLQTYDVNSSGQLHTYIRYLGYLPYSEQQYWKSFNERPKGPISERAFTTDIKGDWSDLPDPLGDLQACLTKLHESGVGWFTLREPNLLNHLNYPLTPSVKAWGDTLVTLAKLVVEGLEKRFFEDIVKSGGAKGDPKWRSISWLKESMRLSGISDEVIDEAILPLRTVQELRTKLSAHSGGDEAGSIRAGLLRKHKTPRLHVEFLCEQLVRSLNIISTLG